MEEFKSRINLAGQALNQLKVKLEPDKKLKQIDELQQETQGQDFWKDDRHAQNVMRELSGLKELIAELETTSRSLDDAKTALELEMADELQQKLQEVEASIHQLEDATYLSGPYDQRDCLLSVHSGQGGTEAMDWAAMILRMYQRFCDIKNWKWELIDQQDGEEAGIKSATLAIHGHQAFGFLRGEKGTHRLVRQSPFNADSLRQTSFAMVEVMPVLDDNAEIVIRPEEVEFEAFRSPGAGGQNVNKVSTAVRIRHLPTGIVVECHSQRQQEQNRKLATQLLRAKLWEIEDAKRQAEMKKIKGNQTQASWGTQIRSYVLHPYKLVKDLRTNVESRTPEAVLGGELNEFITAELRLL
ncbi:MAG: peptide chain release factor 2 [Patescibacteria group bacterium]